MGPVLAQVTLHVTRRPCWDFRLPNARVQESNYIFCVLLLRALFVMIRSGNIADRSGFPRYQGQYCSRRCPPARGFSSGACSRSVIWRTICQSSLTSPKCHWNWCSVTAVVHHGVAELTGRCSKEHETKPFFEFLNVATSFPPRRQPATLGSARGPTAGTPCGNLSCLTRLRPFVCCAFLSHFHVPPWHSAVGPQGV